MRRIFLSVLTIVAVGGAVIGGTGAFFSDTETATGNLFTAGALDLKVDNDSYYNGNRCTFLDAQATTSPGFYWQGNAVYPVPGSPCETSFPESDLDDGRLFFNFTDMKPDDEGEDTISLHVQNDAWACLDVSLTSNDDRSTTEPEGQVDALEDINNTWDGELAQNLQFYWWADDGDNVYETGENSLTNGQVMSLMDLASTSGMFSVPLADSTQNAWGVGGPLPANQVMYIGKAWCFGTLTLDPVPAGQGVNPTVDPGVNCDGTALTNLTQTDGVTLDMAFRTVQARNNRNFVCYEDTTRATITVVKQITNDNGGNNVVADFQLFLDNGVVTIPVTSGAGNVVSGGTYTVAETGVQGYVGSFIQGPGQDCDANGQVTIAAGESKTCVLTNNDLPATITLVKNVTGTPPLASPTVFGLNIDGGLVPHNTSVQVSANTPHLINEAGRAGYTFAGPITGTSNYGQSCPAVLGGSVTLAEGEAITCTITNNKN